MRRGSFCRQHGGNYRKHLRMPKVLQPRFVNNDSQMELLVTAHQMGLQHLSINWVSVSICKP